MQYTGASGVKKKSKAVPKNEPVHISRLEQAPSFKMSGPGGRRCEMEPEPVSSKTQSNSD